ncbi:MAG: ABC transporter permease subunit [Gemmataceae bacterium]
MNLFGPIFKYELVRVARRQKIFRGRCLYALALAGAIGSMLLYFTHLNAIGSISDLIFQSRLDLRAVAQFGWLFFLVFVALQFYIVILWTSPIASTPIPEEKERQTLAILLTTPLSDREIVFGKVAARVAQMLMVLLAGLPILAGLQLVGGLDPILLLVVFAATILLVLSLAAVAAAMSVGASSVKSANAVPGIVTVGYLFGVLSLSVGVDSNLAGPRFSSEVLNWINAGNPIWAALQLGQELLASGRFDTLLPWVFLKYAIFHAVVICLFGRWAAQSLRFRIARQTDSVAKAAIALKPIQRKRPPVYQNYPILWRDLYTVVGGRHSIPRWLKFVAAFFGLFAVVLICGPLLGAVVGWFLSDDRAAFRKGFHLCVRLYGTLILTALLIVGVVGSGILFDRDRRQNTLDDLFLTKLSNREILAQKLLAPLFRMSVLGIIWGLYWLEDLVMGDLSPWAIVSVPPLFALYFVTAMIVGPFYGVVPKVSLPASAKASITFLMLMTWPVVPFAAAVSLTNDFALHKWFGGFAMGLSPPTAIAVLTLGRNDTEFTGPDFPFSAFAAGLAFGVTLYVSLAWLAWRGAARRLTAIRPE